MINLYIYVEPCPSYHMCAAQSERKKAAKKATEKPAVNIINSPTHPTCHVSLAAK